MVVFLSSYVFFLWLVGIKYIIGLDFMEDVTPFSMYVHFLERNIIFLLIAAFLSNSWWIKKHKELN